VTVLYYQNGYATLYEGNCLDILPILPQNSIDMIFADPPYNLSNGGITCQAGRMVSVNKGEWDKSRGIESDHEFSIQWLDACRRILKDDGTIWVSGTMHNIYSIGFAMQQLGYKLLNDISWFKPNASPNLSCRYFTHSHETLIWAAKSDKSRHTFNYQLMKQISGGRQMRSLWLDVNDNPTDVWTINTPLREEKIYGKHPTQKPIKLIERIILAATNPEDTVLDPFTGSSTTGVVAVKHNRHFIGIDIYKEFLELSEKRIKEVESKIAIAPKMLEKSKIKYKKY
jgi:site-specific DNA-methyltransferase (adenine-specific)